MDGFESNEGVIIIAATNRPDILDPAVLRPGRFDRRITVPRPDVKGREGILRVHTKKVPLADDVKLEILARGTPGFVGADLENLVNEAALLAARQDKEAVEMIDFEMAKDKVLMGSERRSMVMSEEERRVAAWHEAGHTLVGVYVEGNDEVHKVTIIPRGAALGVTQFLPTEDRHMASRKQVLAKIAMALGGRTAEEIVFDEVTTGAAGDIRHATHLARMMVCEVGMSDKLGPITYGEKEEAVFLGRDFAQHRADYSERTAQAIDEEIRSIVERQHALARKVLTEHRDALDRLAKALLERETLDQKEIQAVLENRELPKRDPVVRTSWSDRARKSKEARKESIFGNPAPDPAPSA
jgi:cell division protease FtsH